jgi:Flp pilus assembly protein TadB
MPIGVLLISGAVLLQAVGLVWMSRLSRSEF